MSNIVQLKDINKVFGKGTVNEVTLFKDFNLNIQKGDFVSVVGSNGSGKTTTLNILCGSLPIDSGEIIVNGKNINNLKEYKRAKFIGRVFQDPSKGTCGALTILENLALAENKGKPFGLSFAINKNKSKIDYYKTQLELLKLGLEDKINVNVGSLSGGQRQALALLLATMTPIDLLILDEHTAALDPRSSENVMELTQKFVTEKNLTTLMVTHNLKFAVEYGNRMIMMHKGECELDVRDSEKEKYHINDLLKIFNEISIECGN